MKYELMLLIKPTLEEQDAKKTSKQIQENLKKFKATNIKEDFWGKRDLAYNIKSYNEGIYTVINFDADTTAIESLQSNLKLNEDVVRFMLTRVE